jgi:hypothetical protein
MPPNPTLEVITLEWCSDDYYSIQEHYQLVKQHQTDLSPRAYIDCMLVHVAEGRVLLYTGDIQSPVQVEPSEAIKLEDYLAPGHESPQLFVSITEKGEDYLAPAGVSL